MVTHTMVDPTLTAIAGLVMLALIVVPVLYLTYLSARNGHRPPTLGEG